MEWDVPLPECDENDVYFVDDIWSRLKFQSETDDDAGVQRALKIFRDKGVMNDLRRATTGESACGIEEGVTARFIKNATSCIQNYVEGKKKWSFSETVKQLRILANGAARQHLRRVS